MTPLRVAILAYEGAFGTEVFGIADVLHIANRIAERQGKPAPFELAIVGAASGPVTLAGGTTIDVRRQRGRLDLLVVPGFDFARPEELETVLLRRWDEEVAVVRRLFGRGTRIASICVGAFLLGRAGVLRGRSVTTAWAFAPALARLHPSARVDPQRLVVHDGGVSTSAAFSATNELAMDLVRRHAHPKTASVTGKLTLLSTPRETQAPYADTSLMPAPGGSFADVVKAWLVKRMREPYDLPRLAAAFHVSTRTLLRRFQAGADQSPLQFLQTKRIAQAQELLSSTSARIDDVMERVGYSDASTFRRLFESKVGMSPARYRRAFRATSPKELSHRGRANRPVPA